MKCICCGSSRLTGSELSWLNCNDCGAQWDQSKRTADAVPERTACPNCDCPELDYRCRGCSATFTKQDCKTATPQIAPAVRGDESDPIEELQRPAREAKFAEFIASVPEDAAAPAASSDEPDDLGNLESLRDAAHTVLAAFDNGHKKHMSETAIPYLRDVLESLSEADAEKILAPPAPAPLGEDEERARFEVHRSLHWPHLTREPDHSIGNQVARDFWKARARLGGKRKPQSDER